MNRSAQLSPYKQAFDISYTSGAYATQELLRARPDLVRSVYIHSAFRGAEPLIALCMENRIPVRTGDEAFRRINRRENSYVLGVFAKFSSRLRADRPHVVLVRPADPGNLGTIIRTIAGMNLGDLALIAPEADIFHPKTVRASMGALFGIRFEQFDSFGDYRRRFPDHRCYPFMPDGGAPLEACARRMDAPFSLVFGNEWSGLDREFASFGDTVRIPQSHAVDSLNVATAVGIAAYAFASKNGLI